jgi:hypothetical protein
MATALQAPPLTVNEHFAGRFAFGAGFKPLLNTLLAPPDDPLKTKDLSKSTR